MVVLFSIIITLSSSVLVHQVLELLERIVLQPAYVQLQFVVRVVYVEHVSAVLVAFVALPSMVQQLFVALLYVVLPVVAFVRYTSQIYLHHHAAYAPALYGTTAVIL